MKEGRRGLDLTHLKDVTTKLKERPSNSSNSKSHIYELEMAQFDIRIR